MSLAKTLWHENSDLAQTALEHPFVRGIADGTLSLENFQSYIGQDAYFLRAFAKAYALALARCPDPGGMKLFADLLSGVMEELEMHAGYAGRWGVDLSEVAPNAATLHYTDFLLSTAAFQGTGNICAAMTPCMRLYAFLGSSLAKENRADNPYGEWIETYAASDMQDLAETLENALDRYAHDASTARALYRRAMRLELDFFEENTGASSQGH